jgi:Uma2 family endonuclease
VDNYEKLINLGVLTENHKVELIRGEIVDKMAIGDPHSACVKRLTRLFYSRAAALATISVQDPVRLADSEPEPDIAVLVLRADDYAAGKPRANDIMLIVEVADSSLEFDREIKGPLYAENAVPEYWIINLIDRLVEVHRDPRPEGGYATVQTLKAGDSIPLSLLPAVSIAVGEIIP